MSTFGGLLKVLAKMLIFGGIAPKVLVVVSAFGRARISAALGGIFEPFLLKVLI
jgi:hypothetical protein